MGDNLHHEREPDLRPRVDRHKVAATPAPEASPVPPARADRHMISAPPAPEAPEAEPEHAEPLAPAPKPAAAPPRPAARNASVRRWLPKRPSAPPPPRDHTREALRRPALLSDRCAGCGATTKGRAGMVTELVEAGPIRALRVVACSACPDRRRRMQAGL
jgi:hypothetical protein